jgi:arylsulfatase A-like enzyme
LLWIPAVVQRRRIAVVLTVALLAAATAGCARRRPERIVLVVIDTLRRDRVSCYGGATPTPNIDALATTGLRFTNVSASFHQTTMSMAALFTGRTPSTESDAPERPLAWTGQSWCGLARFGDEHAACVPSAVPTLAEALRDVGYATVGIVSNPLLFRPGGYDRGFGDWVEVDAAPDWTQLLKRARPRPLPRGFDQAQRRSGSRVNAAVHDWLARRGGDHFFLYVHYMDAHDSAMVGTAYDDGVEASDAAFGDLVRMLGTANLLHDTVIVLTADHGEALGEPHPLPALRGHFGEPAYEPLMRIPLIVSPPIARDPARFMRTDDTFRLVKEIAGATDVAPPDLGTEEVFQSEQLFRTYRDGRWKSIWRRDERDGHLFDLVADPEERNDVASGHPDILATHSARLATLGRELGTRGGRNSEPSAQDRERMRALGYVD